MHSHINKHLLRIFRRRVISPFQIRRRFHHTHQRQAAPRTHAQFRHRMHPRRPHQLCRVLIEHIMHKHLLHLRLHLKQSGNIRRRNDIFQWISGASPFQDRDLIRQLRIAHTQTDQKPVHLRLRQHLRARRTGWILCRDHHKRLRYLTGNPLHRHLPLFHNFQKGGLSLRRSPVDLIRQKQIAENRARLIDKTLQIFPVYGKARNIRRKHIRRKLHPPCLQPKRPGKRYRHGRLSHTRDIFHQDMTVGKHRHHDLLHAGFFSHNHLPDLPDYILQNFSGILHSFLPFHACPVCFFHFIILTAKKSNTPQQAAGYLTLAAVAKWTCKHVRLARCPRK